MKSWLVRKVWCELSDWECTKLVREELQQAAWVVTRFELPERYFCPCRGRFFPGFHRDFGTKPLHDDYPYSSEFAGGRTLGLFSCHEGTYLPRCPSRRSYSLPGHSFVSTLLSVSKSQNASALWKASSQPVLGGMAKLLFGAKMPGCSLIISATHIKSLYFTYSYA